MAFKTNCPVCRSPVHADAKKCRHCHNYLGFSSQWVWEEGIRVLGLLSMVAAAVVAWKSLEFTVVAQRQREDAVAQEQIALDEREALKADFAAGAMSFSRLQSRLASAPEKSLKKAADKSGDARVRLLLAAAIRLEQQKIPFLAGGKTVQEGFDNSGFVSYLLAQAGALDPRYQGTFSVSRLEKSFPEIKPEYAKPGDLVFLGQGFVGINLSDKKAVGIASAMGIQVFSYEAQSAPRYRRWAYEQDAKMLR